MKLFRTSHAHVVLLSMLITACGSHQEVPPEAAADPVAVEIAKPQTNLSEGVFASGQVEAEQTAAISTRMMGTISRIYVKLGDKVRRGQLLLSIRSEDLQAKKMQAEAMISEAEAQVASAKKDFDRFTNLYNTQSASAKELDNVTLQYKSAQARLKAAREMRSEVDAMMAYSSLRAPFDAVVTQKLADEGSMASPGMPLLMLEGKRNFRVSAGVAESDISQIKLHDAATVEIKSQGISFRSSVEEISQSSRESGGQYLVKLPIPASVSHQVYAGMYASVEIPVKNKLSADGETQAVLVPSSSLVKKDQLTGLYTVSSSQTALLRWVRTGKTYGDQVEILSGLSPEESFIVHAEGKLFNGAPVRIQ